MKILYVLYFDIKETKQIGVAKKIEYQLKALRTLGNEVDLAYCANNKLIIETDKGQLRTLDAPAGKSNYRCSVKRALKEISESYELVYIRYPGSIDYYMKSTFSSIRKSGAKVVLEMPTYPIGGEMIDILRQLKNGRNYVKLAKRCIVYGIHRVLSRTISKDLTCIVSYSDTETIWGTRVINIENGIDCDAISIQSHKATDEGSINLIFVAVFAIWHGLDRLINGMKEYYGSSEMGQKEISLTLVGQSEELERVIDSEAYKAISTHIRVLGPLYGKELDKEYDKADIAVSSLGMHRIGLKSGSTLKTREYCAKGIPFIYGYTEREISESFPYALRVPATEDPIDMNEVIRFYNKLRGSNYSEEMHEFSKKFDWQSQMRYFLNELTKIEDK